MIINNKLESIEAIKELNLNKFPERLFKKGDEKEIEDFINKYPAKYYAIRDKSKSRGIFKLKVLKKDVLKEVQSYEMFSINVSSFNYAKDQVLVGEIEILSNNDVYLIASDKEGYSVRDAISDPTYNIKTNIFDDCLNDIKYFSFLYEYIINNQLKDIIVEFSVFNKNVGINNEKIVIYELRTNY